MNLASNNNDELSVSFEELRMNQGETEPPRPDQPQPIGHEADHDEEEDEHEAPDESLNPGKSGDATSPLMHMSKRKRKRIQHQNICYSDLQEVPYARLPPGQTLTVLGPNGEPSRGPIESELVLVTRGATALSENPLAEVRHCPHFQFGRACQRGARCEHIHWVCIQASGRRTQRPPHIFTSTTRQPKTPASPASEIPTLLIDHRPMTTEGSPKGPPVFRKQNEQGLLDDRNTPMDSRRISVETSLSGGSSVPSLAASLNGSWTQPQQIQGAHAPMVMLQQQPQTTGAYVHPHPLIVPYAISPGGNIVFPGGTPGLLQPFPALLQGHGPVLLPGQIPGYFTTWYGQPSAGQPHSSQPPH